ncbi:type IV pilus assembly protein PilM [Candidatus Daviesbacteria bacterium]|nr:type IV pilus assembly protein PilM [Candidatus Daviesbacteria bacterium]
MAADYITGLDLGSSSIKALVLSHRSKIPKLISFGAIASPHPGLMSESDVDLEATAHAVKSLLASIKAPTPFVVISLPESKIFTRIIDDFPYLSDEELISAIRYSAEEFVPLPVDQVNLYWQVIARSKPQNKTSVFVVASPRSTIGKYLKVLEMAKLKPLALETDLIAAARSIIGSNQLAPTTMIMQLGASSTDFAVVSQGIVVLTRSIATGGNALTRALSQYLSFEPLQAEEYKKVYGLLEDQLDGKVYQILKPLVDVIAGESQRVLQAFRAKNPHNPIKRVVLTGGGSKLPGLVIYLANILGLEIQEADPWAFIEKNQSISAKLMSDAGYFAIAAGLALRKET